MNLLNSIYILQIAMLFQLNVALCVTSTLACLNGPSCFIAMKP